MNVSEDHWRFLFCLEGLKSPKPKDTMRRMYCLKKTQNPWVCFQVWSLVFILLLFFSHSSLTYHVCLALMLWGGVFKSLGQRLPFVKPQSWLGSLSLVIFNNGAPSQFCKLVIGGRCTSTSPCPTSHPPTIINVT